MEDWTEKYRPRTLEDVAGNPKARAQLIQWARSWQQGKPPKKKAVILSGKPGTGKTSCALAIAKDFGWTVIELNASDARNATVIKRVATQGAMNETFDISGKYIPIRTGGRKLIILDEADNLYERISRSSDTSKDLSDRGGKKAIVDTVKFTKQPIMLIVNDLYSLTKGSGESLKKMCLTLPFYEVRSTEIIEVLKRILNEENKSVDPSVLTIIADRSQGDVRSAVNDLQSLCLNRDHVDASAVNVLGFRDRNKIIFDALRDLFKAQHIKGLRESMQSADVSPEMFLLWIVENIPNEYQDAKDRINAFDAVSKADVHFGRVMRRQYYGFWSYAGDLMTGGVAVSKSHRYRNNRYYPPSWLKQRKGGKNNLVAKKAIVARFTQYFHCSSKKVMETVLPTFQSLFQQNMHFACMMKNTFELTESEVSFLLGPDLAYKSKEIMQKCELPDKKQEQIVVEEEQNDKKEEEKNENAQPSLFDFSS